MKWTTKRPKWQEPTYQARYKNHLLTVCIKTEGWGRKRVGYYYLADDIANDVCYNSLWNDVWYADLEETKTACASYVDAKLKEK